MRFGTHEMIYLAYDEDREVFSVLVNDKPRFLSIYADFNHAIKFYKPSRETDWDLTEDLQPYAQSIAMHGNEFLDLLVL